MQLYSRIISIAAALMFSTSACVSTASPSMDSKYRLWLESLKEEMITRGISPNTIKAVYKDNYHTPNNKVIKIDRKQTEFVLTSTEYLNRVITEKRVTTAQKYYRELYPLLKKIEDK